MLNTLNLLMNRLLELSNQHRSNVNIVKQVKPLVNYKIKKLFYLNYVDLGFLALYPNPYGFVLPKSDSNAKIWLSFPWFLA